MEMFLKILILVSATLPVISSTPPSIPGFALTWSDDFLGSANKPPNPADWMIDIGTSYPSGPAHWGSGDVQTYTDQPQNLRLTGDGSLQITPQRDAAGKWTSGRIETQRTDFFAEPSGKMLVSARIQMPNVTGTAATGYWPAFWTLGGTFRGNYWNWPSVGELDIMENVNGVNGVWGVLHCGSSTGGPCNEPNGLGGYRGCPGASCQGNYHVYTLEVDRVSQPEKMSWSVDGVVYKTITESDVGAMTWMQTVDHGHFLLLNVAMGGGFPDGQHGDKTPNAGTVPGRSMFVDWVAVYNSV